MSDGGARRSRRPLRRPRPYGHRPQLLSQSALPEVSAGAAREWLEARTADQLPVEYFHVVFRLPAPVAAIAFQNKAIVYAMLFEATAETLKTIAPDPRHLGAEIGATMLLHRRRYGAAIPGTSRRACLLVDRI